LKHLIVNYDEKWFKLAYIVTNGEFTLLKDYYKEYQSFKYCNDAKITIARTNIAQYESMLLGMVGCISAK
jgi:hypothetical protein